MGLVRTCEYLELRPREEEKRAIAAYLWEMRQEDTTPDEREEYVRALTGDIMLGGRHYEPFCKKTGNVCVIMESPILSVQHTEGLYQPLKISIENSSRMEQCKDRKLPDVNLDGREPIDVFLINHIQKPADCN